MDGLEVNVQIHFTHKAWRDSRLPVKTDVHNPDGVLYKRLTRLGLRYLGLRQAEKTAAVLGLKYTEAFRRVVMRM